MKYIKILISFILIGTLLLSNGCSSASSKKTKETSNLLGDDIKKITLQFQRNNSEIDSKEKIKEITAMFTPYHLEPNSDLQNTKGWIYILRTFDEDNNPLSEITILNETTIRFNNKIYTCDNLSLSLLDEIFGIDREALLQNK